MERNYLLRDIPPALHKAAKAKAHGSRTRLRSVLIGLMAAYVRGEAVPRELPEAPMSRRRPNVSRPHASA